MKEIFAILLVIEVIMIIRGTVQGRMLPWVLALIVTLILIAGTVGYKEEIVLGWSDFNVREIKVIKNG